MTASPSFRQSAPDRLEIRSGGGCLSLFGVPFIAAGIFLILIAVQILPVSNAEEVPLWGWPVMLLMGLVFVAFSSGLVFGRTQVIIDSSASRVTKQWRLLVPVRQEEHSLLDYRVVVLRFSAGDSDSADSYDVSLQGEGGRPSLALFSVTEYGPALTQAGSVAQLLRLPLLDAVGGPGGLQSPAKFLEWGIVMKVSPQATRGHLVLGGILVAVALACVIAGLLSGARFLPLPIFFFGVWGGVELGRCLEHALTQAKV